MTNLEILYLAMSGLCVNMNRENEINERTKIEHGHENSIAVARLKRFDTQYDELRELILKEEKEAQ